MPPLRALVVDDHPLFRLAMRGILEALDKAAEIVEVEGFGAAVARLAAEKFDLVVLDLVLPDMQTPKQVLEVVSLAGDGRVAVVSGLTDEALLRRLRICGLSGLVSKTLPPPRLAAAMRIVLSGGHYFGDGALPREEALTRKQVQVMHLLMQGSSNKAIANALSLSANTVKAHITAILKKLGSASRQEAMAAFSAPWHPETLAAEKAQDLCTCSV